MIKTSRMKAIVAGREIFLDSHFNRHFDELLAGWLIIKFGDIGFIEKYAEDEIITLGTGEGIFDEHPKVNELQRQNECSATLVAKALGIRERPELKRLLDFALNRDRHGPQLLDLVYITNLWRQKFPDKPELVFKEISKIIELEYQEQLYFHTVVKKEYEEKAKSIDLNINGEIIKIVTIRSDEGRLNRRFRFEIKEKPGILIQQRSSGQVQLFGNRKFPIRCLDQIAVVLRYEEQKEKGRIITTEWMLLRKEGKVKGAKEWYYNPASLGILNGSKSAPDTTPTHLSLEKIEELVRIAIDSSSFEPSRATYCRKGICLANRLNLCPWYGWGLKRCREIRRRTYVEGASR